MSDDSVPSPDHAKRGGCPFSATASMPTDEATQTRPTQEEVEAQQKAAHLRKTIQNELRAFFNRPPTRTDRTLSILPYLFLFINGLQMARFLDHLENNFCLAWIAKIHQLNQTTAFAHIILFITVFYVLDNPSIHRLVRFNQLQAFIVDVILFFPSREGLEFFYWLLGPKEFVHTAPPTNDTWGKDFAFAAILLITAFGSISSALGKTPNGIPILSDLIENNTQNLFIITTEKVIRKNNVGPTNEGCPFAAAHTSNSTMPPATVHEPPPTWIDRVLSILPFLFPLIHCLQFARELAPPTRTNSVFWTVIFLAYRCYKSTTLVSLIPFFALQGPEFNPRYHRLIRDNIRAALCLVFAMYCIQMVEFVYAWVLVPVLGVQLPASVIEWSTDFVFAVMLLAIVYASALSLFRDTPPKDNNSVTPGYDPATTETDIFLSVLPFLFPLIHCMQFARWLDPHSQENPFDDMFWNGVFLAYRYYNEMPWVSLIPFLALTALGNNPQLHPLIRNNIRNALGLVFVMYCINVSTYLYAWVVVPGFGVTIAEVVIEGGTDVIFWMVLLRVNYFILLSVRIEPASKYPRAVESPSVTRPCIPEEEHPASGTIRLLAILPYLFLCLECVVYLRFIDLQQPKDRCTAAIAWIHRVYHAIPFGPVWAYRGMWSLARNPRTPRLIRYHIVQSFALYVVQWYTWLLYWVLRSLVEDGIGITIPVHWKDAGTDAAGAALFGTVAYTAFGALVWGIPARSSIPFVSAVVERELKRGSLPSHAETQDDATQRKKEE